MVQKSMEIGEVADTVKSARHYRRAEKKYSAVVAGI